MSDRADAETPFALTRPERALIILARAVGISSAFGLVFVYVPHSWMNAIHQALGMGMLPSEPIVGYLARSTSAFYAMTGGLLMLISFDVRKYRTVFLYLSCGTLLLGVSLFVIDASEGLPWYWVAVEGPFDTLMGATLLWLSMHIRPSEASTRASS